MGMMEHHAGKLLLNGSGKKVIYTTRTIFPKFETVLKYLKGNQVERKLI